ncbi:thioredoxin family protein [Blastopirellula sp. JC732]|uniref:Thioredoxin family protein n=1 Tax=Blastopirellula sediminis TaxID=2894196 RepID=A0A9X1SJ69_9BACT|nr:thioredoxin domain-containing protein [Blastopirellula sediminis]MCC9604665.1 thioredoxin family protein [Blastopirellula sediminis]MCC9632037.1 thioredoxin family protein [Blastopirellula sediminis]
MRAYSSIWTVVLLLIIGSAATAQDAMPWAADLESAKQLAAQKNQLVMVHFWAPNCPPCRMLDATLFKDPTFAAAVAQDYVPVKINAAEETAIANQYGVDRWPQDVIILPTGQMVYRMVSKQEKDKDQYLAVLHGVAIKTAGMSQLASSRGPDSAPVSYPGEAAAPAAGYSRFGAAPAATSETAAAAAPQGQSRFSAQPPASTYSQDNTAAPAAAPTQSRFSTGGYGDMNTAAAPTAQPSQQPSGYAAGQYSPASTPAPTQSRFAAQPSESSYGQGSQYNPPATQAAPQAQPQDRFASQPAASPSMPSQYGSQSMPPQSQFASQPSQPAAPPASAAPQAQPQAKQPEFALDGYCPVTLAEGMKWQKGDARWGAVHQGRVYLFASDVEQRKFLASPDRFSPVLSGNDPVAYIEQGRLVDGDRSHGLTYNGVLYLFSSEDNLKTFWSAPQRYAAQVQQAMLRNSQQLR